jgi:hypothetical protein
MKKSSRSFHRPIIFPCYSATNAARQPEETPHQKKEGSTMEHRTSEISADSAAEAGNEDLHQLIAKRAYELYEKRGGAAAQTLENWLTAEREILGF